MRTLLALMSTVLAMALGAAQSSGVCGNSTFPLSSTQPNVLIIGDSISMAVPYTPGGYGSYVDQNLTKAGIFAQHGGGWYSGGQASNTVHGLLCTNLTRGSGSWLDVDGTFDVIHFNHGLHDLVNCSDNPECSEHVDLDAYGQNLATIYTRLASKAKVVIWAATTPVPNVTTSLGRSYEAAVQYNAQALTSLKGVAPAGQVIVDDLWTWVIKFCGAYYQSCALQLPQNVHFEPLGQQYLAVAVTNSVLKALGRV